MWYVIWATTGREELTRKAIERNIAGDLYSRIAIPQMVKYERKGGVDRRVVKRLFPSYIFVETDRIEEFAYMLVHMPGFSVVLRNEGYEALHEVEERILVSLIKDGDIIDISTGFIKNGKVRIMTGALTGMEGMIKRVNKRKRLATIEVVMFNRKTSVNLGLEVLETT